MLNRHAKANNKYINEQYDSNLPNSYLMYYDMNNMDGAAMRHYLPYGEFEWMDNINFCCSDFLNSSDESEACYIFEVDLEYPLELHEAHKDFRLCLIKLNFKI